MVKMTEKEKKKKIRFQVTHHVGIKKRSRFSTAKNKSELNETKVCEPTRKTVEEELIGK